MRVATTQQKTVRAANGNGTVDSPGLLLAVKVLAADLRDRAGGKVLLHPVVATSYIRSEKRHVESVMIVAKQAQRADF